MRTNAFREEVIANHKVKEYTNKLQGYWKSYKPDLNICRS